MDLGFLPSEWLGSFVIGLDEGFDMGLEVRDRMREIGSSET